MRAPLSGTEHETLGVGRPKKHSQNIKGSTLAASAWPGDGYMLALFHLKGLDGQPEPTLAVLRADNPDAFEVKNHSPSF
jgi:hypothetical protein